jgi:hypothetical protein
MSGGRLGFAKLSEKLFYMLGSISGHEALGEDA